MPKVTIHVLLACTPVCVWHGNDLCTYLLWFSNGVPSCTGDHLLLVKCIQIGEGAVILCANQALSSHVVPRRLFPLRTSPGRGVLLCLPFSWGMPLFTNQDAFLALPFCVDDGTNLDEISFFLKRINDYFNTVRNFLVIVL